MTTKTPQVQSPKKLLQRLRQIHDSIRYTTKKLHRQKMELYTTTYLFAESRFAQDAELVTSDVWQELAETLGQRPQYWAWCYRQGRFIRDHRIDLDKCKPSTLNRAARNLYTNAQLRKVVTWLNDGMGVSEMSRRLARWGIGWISPIPPWKRQDIRAKKKSWGDWKPDMEKLAAMLAITTDAPELDVRVEVHINGARKPAIVGHYKR